MATEMQFRFRCYRTPQLVSARMNKRQQMRWSPRGAHRVLQVRAAVLDGRFGHQAIPLAA